MAEAVVVYRGDWAAVRGVLVPRSIVQSGRTDEWITARSRGEVLECPEVQRTWRIADHMQNDFTKMPLRELLSEFQRAVGRVSGILVLDDICKEIERRVRVRDEAICELMDDAGLSTLIVSGGLDNACRLRVTFNKDKLTFELDGSQVL